MFEPLVRSNADAHDIPFPSMKCPYPDCAARAADHGAAVPHQCRPVARHVYQCVHCQRLGLRCEKGTCPALNRPYSLHCRRCGDDARHGVWFGSSATQWNIAGRCDPSPDTERVQTDSVVEVCRLPEQSRTQRQPLLELRFLDGLLALHQAGAFTGLLHPFRTSSPLLWKAEEKSPSDLVTAAFPPFRLPESRLVVFSSPQRAVAVDVWSLPGWSHAADPLVHELFAATGGGSRQLAAAPVALSDRQVGLLVRDASGRYFWRVAAVDAWEDGDAEGEWTEMPLDGEPCRAIQLADQAVAIATPRGHWLWRLQHARENRVADLVTLYRAPAGKPLLMDEREQRNDHFAFPRRFLDFRTSRESGDVPYVSWYFVCGEGPSRMVGNYRFYFDKSRAEDPVILDRERNATPLGVFSSEGRSRMLFVSDGRLFCDDTGDRLSPYDRHIRVPNESELTGLSFQEPLLLGVRRGSQGNQLAIHALESREYQRQIDVGPLRSDPLAWASWLWTVELETNYLVLRRRHLFEETADA